MPRCEGLPSGPCPYSGNDESVKKLRGSSSSAPLVMQSDFRRLPPSHLARGDRGTKNSVSSSSFIIHAAEVKCSGCDKMGKSYKVIHLLPNFALKSINKHTYVNTKTFPTEIIAN